MYCWLCGDILSAADYYLLPEKDDNIQITKQKNYEIKIVDKFEFIYHTVCPHCLIMYLDNYPVNFRKLLRREIEK
jgi:hypothetical protein